VPEILSGGARVRYDVAGEGEPALLLSCPAGATLSVRDADAVATAIEEFLAG